MTAIPDGSLAGHLIVATPSLADPNFSHAVVLLLDHDEEGAFGVILNRPSETTTGEAMPAWQGPIADPAVMFVGGPVQPVALIGLGRLRSELAPVPIVAPGIGVADLTADPGEVAEHFSALRFFAGYAGWEAGQLEEELAQGAWFVVEVDPVDVFSAAPGQLWRVVLARQGGVFLTIPPDPSWN